jgi:hypothetical protein
VGHHLLPLRLDGGALPRDPATEPLEQLGQNVSRALVGEAKALVEVLMCRRKQQLRRRENAGMDMRKKLPQVELGPRGSNPAGRGTHDGHRLCRERGSSRKARTPVDRVGEHSRYAVVVFRCRDQNAISARDRALVGGDTRGIPVRFYVGVIERQLAYFDQLYVHTRRCELLRGAEQRPVE